MNTYKKILSYLLLSVYVLSGLHGTISHCQDDSHSHVAHEHHSHGNDEDKESQIQAVTHSIYHSFAHFLEHIAHDHECCVDALVVVNKSNVQKINKSQAGILCILADYSTPDKTYRQSLPSHDFTVWSDPYLSLASLRGPPSFV